jgi:CRISPR/Cas system-associated exonuclease Cas4 (RecB family)
VKNFKFVVFLFLVPNISFSQLKGHISNSETGEPVPYVNIGVEGVFAGTTSNRKGEFEFKESRNNNVLVFSAIGYKIKKVKVESDQLIINLTPSVIELEEVIVGNKKANIKQKVGVFNKSKINNYFACGSYPWMVARYFPYKENYESTTFLKEMRILTDSDIKDAKFNIRLYKVNRDNQPGEYLFENNIYGYAKKGKSITKIDLSDFFIQFPKEGFFIVIEWLIIEENYYKHWVTYKDKRKVEEFSYEPSLGLVFSSGKDPNSWSFSSGKWRKEGMDGGYFLKQAEDSYSMLAIELMLSN